MMRWPFATWLAVVGLLAGSVSFASDWVVNGQLGRQLDQHLSSRVPKGLNCVALVAERGKLVLCQGYGWSDAEKATPWTPETVFDIGSISKQFTAAAVMELVEQGKLDVNDRVSKYLGEMPADKQSITLHHLLTHTAGLVDVLGGDYVEMSQDELLEQSKAVALRWTPGERYAYSNLGYSLLATIIERASGESYERFLAERLFKPAGMRLTGYVLPDWNQATVARGVTFQGADWGRPHEKPWAADGPYWNLRGNGGLLSTVGDLYRWHKALLGNEVVGERSKQAIFAPHAAETKSGRSHYGYGWSIATTVRGTKAVMHNGGNGVFSADFRRYLDEDVVVIMGSSDARCIVDNIEREMLPLLFP